MPCDFIKKDFHQNFPLEIYKFTKKLSQEQLQLAACEIKNHYRI